MKRPADIGGRIVVYDSGVGGLNILNALKRRLPYENYIYIADERYMPYGTKDVGFLKKRITELLCCFGEAKAIVIACNTASSVYSVLGLDMPNVFEIIKVTSEYANGLSRDKRIGVIATDMTVSLGRYQEYLTALGADVYPLGYSELVDIIESGKDYSIDEYQRRLDGSLSQKFKYFYGKGIDTLICGCTHFGYIIDDFKRYLGNIMYVVSDEAAALYVCRRIDHMTHKCPECRIYTTADAGEFEDKMRMLGYIGSAEHLDI